MKASIRLGRIWGIELGLHFSWIVIALLITFSVAQQFSTTNPEWGPQVIWSAAVLTGVLFFAALFAHELSHAFVAKMRGLPIRRITLFLLGGVAQVEKEAEDPATEFWMAIVGPIMSAIVGAICLGAALALGWQPGHPPASPLTAITVWLGYINVALAAFNMIPGFPLDGGRVLRAVIWWINHDKRRSTLIAARVGEVIAALFIGWGIFRFFAGAGLSGLWIAFIGWFLMQAASASYLQTEASAALRGLRAGDMMSRECGVVSAGMNLRDFVDRELLRTGRRCFIVVDDGHMAGMVTPHEIKSVPAEQWADTPIAGVMVPTSRIHAITPDTPADEALELMGREDINQVPVVADGRLEGVLTRGHLLQVLRSRAELRR
ncbi:MAG: site-2 protease family protein [Terriglobales bacterium]